MSQLPERILEATTWTKFGEEHREATHLVNELRNAKTIADAWDALTETSTELGQHFNEEEEDVHGLFDWFVVLVPSREADVLMLREQHAQMLTVMESMIHRSGDLSGDGRFIEECTFLADLIERHEDLEMSVLASAVQAVKDGANLPS